MPDGGDENRPGDQHAGGDEERRLAAVVEERGGGKQVRHGASLTDRSNGVRPRRSSHAAGAGVSSPDGSFRAADRRARPDSGDPNAYAVRSRAASPRSPPIPDAVRRAACPGRRRARPGSRGAAARCPARGWRTVDRPRRRTRRNARRPRRRPTPRSRRARRPPSGPRSPRVPAARPQRAAARAKNAVRGSATASSRPVTSASSSALEGASATERPSRRLTAACPASCETMLRSVVRQAPAGIARATRSAVSRLQR